MFKNKALKTLLQITLICWINAEQCPILNSNEPTFYDPSCAQGGLGCNAGGNLLCRFCGYRKNKKYFSNYFIKFKKIQVSIHFLHAPQQPPLQQQQQRQPPQLQPQQQLLQ